MQVATHPSLVQIDLNISGMADLFVVLVVQANRYQAITRQYLTTCSGRIRFNKFSNNALPRVGPAHTIPGRSFLSQPLGKVQDSRRHQQGGAGQHQPRSSCKDRSLHLNSPTRRLSKHRSQHKNAMYVPKPMDANAHPSARQSHVTLISAQEKNRPDSLAGTAVSLSSPRRLYF